MLLGLDLGTTNVKALVTDRDGRLLARGSRPVRLFHLEGAGVEQDLHEIEQAALDAIQEALQSVEAALIEAIGVSSQGGAMQVLDDQGKPLGRVVSWLDQRGRSFDDALTAQLGRDWFRSRIGHGCSGLAIGQVLRLRQEQAVWLRASHRLGFVGDLVVSRLCGRAAHDGTSCGLTLLHNPGFRDYDPDVLQQVGLQRHQLPDLLSPREVAGGLRPEVARVTGLRTGIAVSPAIHDQYASALGTGAVRAGTVMVGTGTAWVALAASDHLPMPVTDEAFVCGHVLEGLFGQILSLVNGGSALAWALELVGMAGKPWNEIEALLLSSPAGSGGIIFWPFLVPRSVSGFAPRNKARLSGLQLSHRQAHIVRAVVEGLVFDLNRHLGIMHTAGLPTQRLVLSGGAAGSQVTTQIVADVTGLPLHCVTGSEASLLGAAIIARGLLEPHRSLADLAGEMVPPPRVVQPGEDAPCYQGRYQEYLGSLTVPEPTSL